MSNSQFFVYASPMTRPNGDDGQGNTDDGVPELVVTVFRNHFDESGTVSVDYRMLNGTAIAGVDYDGSADPLTGTLDFVTDYSQDPPRMDQWKAIRIALLDNQLASGDLTFICTLDASPKYRFGSVSFLNDTYTHTATCVIQDGTVFYISETGSASNDGLTPANPKDDGSIQSLIVSQTSGGVGRAVLLKAGETFYSSFSVDGAKKGGTISNPFIIGRYGSGVRPILIKDGPLFGYVPTPDFIPDTANTFQDIDCRGQVGFQGQLFVLYGAQVEQPYQSKNVTVLRSKFSHPEGYDARSILFYIQATNPDVITNGYPPEEKDDFRCMFNEITRGGAMGSGIGAKGCRVVACYFHDNGEFFTNGAQDWGTYYDLCLPLFSYANRYANNIQGCKFRRCEGSPEQDSIFECNVVDGRGALSLGSLLLSPNSDALGVDPVIEQWPLKYFKMRRNLLIANPRGNILWNSDADNSAWAYKPEEPGAQFVLDGFEFTNNTCVIESNTQYSLSGVDSAEQQNRNVLWAHNTVIVNGTGDVYAFQFHPYSGRYTAGPPYGQDDPLAYTQDWAQEQEFKGNLIALYNPPTIGCALRYAGGSSVHSPYDEGANPEVYIDADYNHYYSAGTPLIRPAEEPAEDTLASFKVSFPAGGDDNSLEANPILVRGRGMVSSIPLAPHTITSQTTHDYYGNPRSATSSAGAINRGENPASGVFMRAAS